MKKSIKSGILFLSVFQLIKLHICVRSAVSVLFIVVSTNDESISYELDNFNIFFKFDVMFWRTIQADNVDLVTSASNFTSSFILCFILKKSIWVILLSISCSFDLEIMICLLDRSRTLRVHKTFS